MLRLIRLVTALALAVAAAAHAAPYLPRDDAVVLERLPLRPGDPALGELRRLRAQLAADPRNAGLAQELARRYYLLALADGDPRYIGYAQSALAPWERAADAPAGLLEMRAALRQFVHDYAGALRDLEAALARDPGRGYAWFQKAVIHMVQADYALARPACEAMADRYAALMATGCLATVDALAGRAEPAYARLSEALGATPAPSPTEKLWVLTRLGEIAARLGRAGEADAHFRAALALGITDAYLLATYAEFLLDQGRPGEVVALLKGKERSEVLLVRLALAEQALGLPEAAEHGATIGARFAAARLRGDKLHIQDEARFTLHFLGRPQEALALARENYATQREPSDARMLLEAALAARQPQAASPALLWLRETGHEDVELKRLAQRLEGTQ